MPGLVPYILQFIETQLQSWGGGEEKVFFPMVGPRPRDAKAIARGHTAACEELAGMGPWSG